MAGEKIGLACEAFVCLALRKCKQTKEGKLLTWNEKPPQLRVVPDFVIGNDLSQPKWIILVTSTGCTNNSQMKFWRNLGEFCEAKIKTSDKTKVATITFDAKMKADLKSIQAAVFDSQLIVGEKAYGRVLLNWIVRNANSLPKENAERAEEIAEALSSNKSLAKAFDQFTADVQKSLGNENLDLRRLWQLERSRRASPPSVARNTFVRHGAIKAAVLGYLPGKRGRVKDAPSWLLDLGILRKSVGGFSIADQHLNWFISSDIVPGDQFSSFLRSCSTDGFLRQVEKVQSVGLLENYTQYVIKNLKDLAKPKTLQKHLKQLHNDPSAGLGAINGEPKNVWLFDVLSALYRCKNPGARFGYPSFSQHELASESQIGNMTIGEWSSCFMNQFFNRKESFQTPASALNYVCYVMAQEFAKLDPDFVLQSTAKIKAEFLEKEFGQDFDVPSRI